MHTTPSANALATANEQPYNGGLIIEYAVTPTTIPLVGELIQLKSYTPGTPGDGLHTPPYVQRAAAAGNFLGIGACVGGSSLVTNPVKGGLVMVQVEGPCLVLFKGHSVTHDSIIVSTAAAGKAKLSATPVLGKTFGKILQTVTTTTTLVYCYIHCI